MQWRADSVSLQRISKFGFAKRNIFNTCYRNDHNDATNERDSGALPDWSLKHQVRATCPPRVGCRVCGFYQRAFMVSETAIPPCSCNRYDYFARSYFVGVVVRRWFIYQQWWESRNLSRELHDIRFRCFHVWFGCAETQYEFDANRSIADLLEGGLEDMEKE
jgi:hypothetical protein